MGNYNHLYDLKMSTIKITLVLMVAMSFQINAQEYKEHTEKHDDGRGFRIAGIIGHTLINTEGIENVFVPSWGLDIEYWLNPLYALELRYEAFRCNKIWHFLSFSIASLRLHLKM